MCQVIVSSHFVMRETKLQIVDSLRTSRWWNCAGTTPLRVLISGIRREEIRSGFIWWIFPIWTVRNRDNILVFSILNFTPLGKGSSEYNNLRGSRDERRKTRTRRIETQHQYLASIVSPAICTQHCHRAHVKGTGIIGGVCERDRKLWGSSRTTPTYSTPSWRARSKSWRWEINAGKVKGTCKEAETSHWKPKHYRCSGLHRIRHLWDPAADLNPEKEGKKWNKLSYCFHFFILRWQLSDLASRTLPPLGGTWVYVLCVCLFLCKVAYVGLNNGEWSTKPKINMSKYRSTGYYQKFPKKLWRNRFSSGCRRNTKRLSWSTVWTPGRWSKTPNGKRDYCLWINSCRSSVDSSSCRSSVDSSSSCRMPKSVLLLIRRTAERKSRMPSNLHAEQAKKWLRNIHNGQSQVALRFCEQRQIDWILG